MRNLKKENKSFRLKQVIITTLLLMLFGTALELYLLHHYDGNLQLIPLLCLSTLLLFAVVLFFYKANFLLMLFKIVLVITALSGFYGTFLHLKANYEFEKELSPTANDQELLLESLSGAFPTLAPASMIVLALIGYAYLLLLKQK